MPPTAAPIGFAPDSQLSGVRALIVDDEPDVIELLQLLLTMFGLEVRSAGSADEAFGRFEDQRPDIIISDIQMTGGTGLELIRRIRELPTEQGGLTPAIAVSGAADVEETLDAGFHFHFTKPVPAQLLLDAIRSFVREEQVGADRWSLGVDGETITIRWNGHVTGGDMRAMASALLAIIEHSAEGYQVVSDLRRLSSFTPSVGAVAQLAVWRARSKIRSVVVVGGSSLARAISRSACRVLGVPCSLVDTL